jgi:5-methylcytosine-specific restriction endonuclease McrA
MTQKRQHKDKKMSNSQVNYINREMRTYVLMAMTRTGREIKCEWCGRLDQLELHHKKYFPQDTVTIFDLEILCPKCHRNAKNGRSDVRTEYRNGERYCVMNHTEFAY